MKEYSSVRQKLNGFFQVRKNVIFERAKFNRRSQLAGETADQFIASLYNLAENCSYAELKDEMIRDRLVVGIRDMALSEKLQLDAELTLEKAKKAIRQREAVHEHQDVLVGDRNPPTAVDAMQQTKKARKTTRAKKPEGPHLWVSNVHAVERVAIRKRSAQLAMQSATSANTRDTIVHNVLLNQLLLQLQHKSLAMEAPCTLTP